MSLSVRDGAFDVVVVAGPRVRVWPSAGARTLSVFCAEMGLSVGVFGGEGTRVRGVLPLPGTGGLCLIEDLQGRVHRISARAVVKVSPGLEMIDPFPGWRSPGLIPLSTAQTMLDRDGKASWAPGIAVLGSGNAAFRFASRVLETANTVESPHCYVIEPGALQGNGKPFMGWEVEKRRFESLGGRFLSATPLSLKPGPSVTWELRVQDPDGIRLLEVLRVVAAGAGDLQNGVREYPSGSLLFEMEQTAHQNRYEDFEGWALEEERARALGAKVVRALLRELAERKEAVEGAQRKSRVRLKGFGAHRANPFHPEYAGKWLKEADRKALRVFSGVPQKVHAQRWVASIECVEDIACNLCEKVCPESAIRFSKKSRRDEGEPILVEADCTACGACLSACPSGVPVMLMEKEGNSVASLTLPWRGVRPWEMGETAQLVNRRGDLLGNGRVTAVVPGENETQLVQVSVASHLLWDARALRKPKTQAIVGEDPSFFKAIEREADVERRIEILLNGEKRYVRETGTVIEAFRQIGFIRSQDALNCSDGSCGLCAVQVDGVKRLACQTPLRKGMSIRAQVPEAPGEEEFVVLCPCEGITVGTVEQMIEGARLKSPDAVASGTGVGVGRCHGQICEGAFRKLLCTKGIPTENWIDWRFPFMDWPLGSSEKE